MWFIPINFHRKFTLYKSNHLCTRYHLDDTLLGCPGLFLINHDNHVGNKFLPHPAVIFGLWSWFLMNWELFSMFLLSQEKNFVEEIESIMGARAERSSPSLICIPQKSLAITRDFWNTDPLGWTRFGTGAHDGFSIFAIASTYLLLLVFPYRNWFKHCHTRSVLVRSIYSFDLSPIT